MYKKEVKSKISTRDAKERAIKFWDNRSCGEDLYLNGEDAESFELHRKKRYALEPYILEFANFKGYSNKLVLEVGVGLGADLKSFHEGNAYVVGVDITRRALLKTKRRLYNEGSEEILARADGEMLPFNDNTFDLVYSWGVVHHSSNVEKALGEFRRVLKVGGELKIMLYQKNSIVGYLLWIRYGLLNFRPFCGLDYIYRNHLESYGTKAYTKKDAEKLLKEYREIRIKTTLTHADMLLSSAGQRHRGIFLSIGRRIIPRRIIKRFFNKHGLFMMIRARK